MLAGNYDCIGSQGLSCRLLRLLPPGALHVVEGHQDARRTTEATLFPLPLIRRRRLLLMMLRLLRLLHGMVLERAGLRLGESTPVGAPNPPV